MYTLVALILLTSLALIRAETASVPHHVVSIGEGIPALVHEPMQAKASMGKLPAIVLVHGVGESPMALSAIARHFARAGYVVVAPTLRGHGRNRRRFPRASSEIPGVLVGDLEATVRFAREHVRTDEERIAVVGNGLGGSLALSYAGRDPSLAAVVALSGGIAPVGPYPAPNIFLLWGSGASDAERRRLRALGATLAGRERLVLGRTYGDPERGTGVRLEEIDGGNPALIPLGREAPRRILSWLEGSGIAAPGSARAPESDRSLLWLVVGGIAALMLLRASLSLLKPVLPRAALPAIGRTSGDLGVLVVATLGALALRSLADVGAGRGALDFVPLGGVGATLGSFALSGFVALLWLGLAGRVHGRGLRDPRTYLATGILLALAYIAGSALGLPFGEIVPSPQRLRWCAAAAGLVLPYFAATEWLLRGVARPWRGGWGERRGSPMTRLP